LVFFERRDKHLPDRLWLAVAGALDVVDLPCASRSATRDFDEYLVFAAIDGNAWLDHGGQQIIRTETVMANEKGPNIKKKQKCKNCEGKGLLKKGDRVVKCQRCKGTGVR
jgi:hypothetical protein